MVLREDCVAELNNYIDPLYRFKFGTMHAGTVTYNITQYSGVRKLETVTVAEVNAYVLNSPLRRFTDPKGSAGQETQQERPEELSFLHGALSLNHSIVTPSSSLVPCKLLLVSRKTLDAIMLLKSSRF
ncbi:BnaC03g76320D [Brassica napus]|uniref:BnaC03g76320D protein n=1 Tax=Brassica napus TaxID=3708 RepID=A0A078IZW1_BRANA|nr:BnaC03g76320D [Brassica napus]